MNQAVIPGDNRSRPAPAAIPFVHGASLVPFVDFLESCGAPAQRWLATARVPTLQLYEPEGLVPLHAGYRFLELATRREGLADLACQVAGRHSVFLLGPLGTLLRRSATVLEYLHTGARLVSVLENRGTSFWLTSDDSGVRVNQSLAGGPGPGPAVADAYTFLLTVNAVREMLEYDWWPGEVRLRSGTDAALESWVAAFPGKVLTGQPYTSFTIPRSALLRPLPARLRQGGGVNGTGSDPGATLPDTFLDSIERLVDAMLLEGQDRVSQVAEAAGHSTRNLQRRLTDAGTSFTSLLVTCRLRRAKQWLESSTMPVAEIAAELDYTDASNFARAFRRETGLSPAAYRQASALVREGARGQSAA